jgi:cytochrome P450
MLLSREGADHSRLRRLANPAFAPKLVRKLTPVFQEMANEIIDGFSKKGTCEFVADFSEPYATQVICALLGLPRSEWRGLAQLAVDMGLALGVTFKQDEEKINAATDKLFGYAAMAVEALKKNGLGDDFLSLLVKANEEDKAALSDQELYDMIVLAIFGGIDTTVTRSPWPWTCSSSTRISGNCWATIPNWHERRWKKSCVCARPSPG